MAAVSSQIPREQQRSLAVLMALWEALLRRGVRRKMVVCVTVVLERVIGQVGLAVFPKGSRASVAQSSPPF